jgi:hypothetical protein
MQRPGRSRRLEQLRIDRLGDGEVVRRDEARAIREFVADEERFADAARSGVIMRPERTPEARSAAIMALKTQMMRLFGRAPEAMPITRIAIT